MHILDKIDIVAKYIWVQDISCVADGGYDKMKDILDSNYLDEKCWTLHSFHPILFPHMGFFLTRFLVCQQCLYI